jgi:hypothetical protein
MGAMYRANKTTYVVTAAKFMIMSYEIEERTKTWA